MKNNFIKIIDVSHVYKTEETESGVEALSGVNLIIEKGKFTVILGKNGSGKSTLAKLMNALLLPSKGVVLVKGVDTRDEPSKWEIRRVTGMVFQNPDNQIVGTTVEEDVAFGPENLGVEPVEIRRRVDEVLDTVGMKEYSNVSPHFLSGGQKQRIAIAGILAMKPECIVLDEATSMLDPMGRKEVMAVLKKLNREEKITIVHITHNMEETCMADRVIVIDDGKIAACGTPSEVFSDVKKIKSLKLDVPQVTELLYELEKEGLDLPRGVLTVEEALKAIAGLKRGIPGR